MMRRKRWYVVAAVVATLAVLGMGGCAYFKDWEQLPATKQDERTVHIVSHGWHTGIVVAREDLNEELRAVTQQLGDAAFYEFGWGDKAFYQSDDPGIGIMFRAVFLPTPSTMHVVAVPEEPAKYFDSSESLTLHVSSGGLDAMIQSIAASFAKDAQGKSLATLPGLYGHSFFFDANGSYYFGNTCNTWTVRMLRRAGVPTTTFLTQTAGSVMRQGKWAIEKYSCCASGSD